MARRGDKSQAEALEVVEGVVERVDLKLAAVAGPGIDRADRQAAAEPAPRDAVERGSELGNARILRNRRGLGQGTAEETFEEDPAHGGSR